MRSKKVSKKSKAILLVIDLLLLVAIAAAGLFCYRMVEEEKAEPKLDYAYEAAMLDQRIKRLDTQIEEQMTLLEEDLESEAYLLEKQLLEDQMAEVRLEMEDISGQTRTQMQVLTDLQDPERMKELIEEVRTEYGQTVRQLEDMIMAGESDYRICYLTFDDGPTYMTPDFLDRLQELDVKATFFTIGNSMQGAATLRNSYLRREAREGHTIANHTYSHAHNGSLYKSSANFLAAVEQQDELVYEVTGMHTDIVRFPCGSYYGNYRSANLQGLEERGYEWMDWIGNAFDSGNKNRSSSWISSTVINQVRQDKITVVLMHDWNKNTLGALRSIVNTLREENYLFLPLFKESSMNGNCVPKFDN